MGQFANAEWYKRRLADYAATYGAVPPPWVYAENSHPYSIRWRMGEGETLLLVFHEWWEQQHWSETERVTYFRQWPPPRWIPWMADALWDLQPWEGEGEFDHAPHFARIRELGFSGVDE